MKKNQAKIKSLLSKLIEGNPNFILKPASVEDIILFKKRAVENNIDSFVMNQLVEFYEVADGFEYDMLFHFLGCADEDIFDT